jgi:CxxC motif-containing protein (DUF1111 family)
MLNFKSFLFIIGFAWTPSVGANPLVPGGEHYSSDMSKNAFSHPPESVSKDIKNQFFVGNSFFKQSWVAAPSSTLARDGLGPTYNAVACASCHQLDGRGAAYLKNDKLGVSLLFRLKSFNQGVWSDHTHYGGQLNPFSIENVPSEVSIAHKFTKTLENYPDGSSVEIRKPVFIFKDLNFGLLGLLTTISPRIGAQLIGLGLIEGLDVVDIQKNEDPLDINQDGISGFANKVLNKQTGHLEIGRFGWKAEQPTVRQQVAGAFLGDIGITSSLFPETNCPIIQIECSKVENGGDPELEEKVLDRVTTYSQYLSVPISRFKDLSDYESGLSLFKSANCNSCHTESYTIESNTDFSNKTIYPFSDFLLHDMGDGLSDFTYDDVLEENITSMSMQPLAREWRTPPLWGIGLLPVVNGHQQLLHDGRANGVEEAILWHGGEAEESKSKFKSMNKKQRDELISFLNKL